MRFAFQYLRLHELIISWDYSSWAMEEWHQRSLALGQKDDERYIAIAISVWQCIYVNRIKHNSWCQKYDRYIRYMITLCPWTSRRPVLVRFLQVWKRVVGDVVQTFDYKKIEIVFFFRL